MSWARPETIRSLHAQIAALPVVDAHTHIQDDLTGFDAELARQNLSGTQAPFNRMPQHVIDAGLKQGVLARRTMADPTHAAFYSWFAQAAEGRRNRLDEVIALLGDNSEEARRAAGRALLEELQPARYSEYAEWLRIMFRLYDLPGDIDPVDPDHFDTVCDAVKARRNDPAFAARILREAGILGYVTSIENRDRIPLNAGSARVDNVDLAHATHPESWNMFDAGYLLWPGGATDFGLFTGGHKYEAERYLLNLETFFGRTIERARDLKAATGEFLRRILWSPATNPASRVRYTDTFQPLGFRLSGEYSAAAVNSAIRYHKGHLEGDALRQVIACVTEALLETLEDIGREMCEAGEEYGSCLQIAVGVDYFMDRSREIQSFPGYTAGLPQSEFPVWTRYPHIHFEYIVAHEGLYRDLANAAKQVGNISVGAWWHFFRRDSMARMIADQMTMGPVTSIACGFTDARFVEMAAAKYASVRWALAAALADRVDDPFSSLHGNEPEAARLAGEMLWKTPCAKHHLPISATGGR